MDITEPVLLILLSLAEQPRHGYAILQDAERMSQGRVQLSTGTLYGALRRLLEDQWIERFEEKDSSRGRQAYRLTRSEEHTSELQSLTNLVCRLLLEKKNKKQKSKRRTTIDRCARLRQPRDC